MGAFIDLTNQRFGRLVVIEKVEKYNKEWVWKCQCDCGNIALVEGRNLRGGITRSCGCLKKESDKKSKNNTINLIGQVFGHLTVKQRLGSDNRGEAIWLCQCDCGNEKLIPVLSSNLRRGHTTSCGCTRRSHGEQKIAQLLTDNNIHFEMEKVFFKFSNGTNARFDFYVDNKYLIEYDGETHYAYNMHGWHNEKQLQSQQERDIIKNQWCLDNNIPLIRIPFTIFPELTINDLLLESSKYIITK